MLAVLVLVAPMGITGCGILEALLAADPGGTGAGPVAAHPKSAASGQKVAGILTAVGKVLEGAGSSGPDSSGFFPGDEVVPGVVSLPPEQPAFQPQGFVPQGIAPRAAQPEATGPRAAVPQDKPAEPDPNSVVTSGPRLKGIGDIESGPQIGNV